MKAQGRSREGIRKARRVKPASRFTEAALPDQPAPLNRQQRRVLAAMERGAHG